MNQPIAKISKNDINRIILRDYSITNKDEVLNILSKFKGDDEKGIYRVWAALLKISNGDIDRLDKNIENAIIDYRDILAIAEYPEYSQKVGFNSDKFDKKELKKIIDSDWHQYQEWLNAD